MVLVTEGHGHPTQDTVQTQRDRTTQRKKPANDHSLRLVRELFSGSKVGELSGAGIAGGDEGGEGASALRR